MADETQPFDEQLASAFETLEYPVEHERELSPGFPSWANTRFYGSEFTMTPREVLAHVPEEYPYTTVDELVEAIQESLREAGYDL